MWVKKTMNNMDGDESELPNSDIIYVSGDNKY